MKRGNWSDWKWQLSNRIHSLNQLTDKMPQIERASSRFPMSVTPYYYSLIKNFDYSDPVYSMSIPNEKELIDYPFLKDDPLNEEHHTAVEGLVHRYPDRALVLLTSHCSVYCRHCTRKRVAGQIDYFIDKKKFEKIISYLKLQKEIHDVVISGGDPLTMDTDKLEYFIKKIREIEHIDIIRIGTRVPVVLPMRIDDELTSMLKKYHPIWINTHFNHPQEITKESSEACTKLADAGIPLGNQTVLLRGINDDPEIIMQLCRMLVKIRVRPYYLFICDLVKGVEHFRTTVQAGIDIMEHLRGRLSGLAIPTFVVDAPNGGGKIPVIPDYILAHEQDKTVLRNYEGKVCEYPNPVI